MILLTPNTEDAALEKHVPVIIKTNSKTTIKVGDISHPMEDNHYIEWIEIITNTQIFRKNLQPTDDPIAQFETIDDIIEVRAYCNIHGLWKTNK